MDMRDISNPFFDAPSAPDQNIESPCVCRPDFLMKLASITPILSCACGRIDSIDTLICARDKPLLNHLDIVFSEIEQYRLKFL
jgi:hypothetical protein